MTSFLGGPIEGFTFVGSLVADIPEPVMFFYLMLMLMEALLAKREKEDITESPRRPQFGIKVAARWQQALSTPHPLDEAW